MDNSAILGHLESGIYISTVALGSMIFSFIFFNRIFTRTADIYSAYYKALKAEAMVTGWF
jgi:hypothetical protein